MASNKTDRRQHYWDGARAFLMLLGIPYHVAMLYHPGGWIVAVDRESPVLGALSEAIHLFRMPAFFVVAGYFAALLLARREAKAWLGSRLFRLGVPLVTSLIVLVPVMNMLGELSGRGAHAAFEEWRYQTATSGGYWVRHLWFIIVLLYLSAASAALCGAFPRLSGWQLGARADAWAARWLPLVVIGAGVGIGLFEAGAIEAFYAAGLNTNLWQQILRLDDLLMAAPFFAAGALLQRSPRVLEAFGQPSRVLIPAAILVLGIGVAFAEQAWAPLGRFLGAVAAVVTTQLVVSLARAFLDRPNRIVARLVEGSFVIYLFHLPILIGLYDVVKQAGLAPAIAFPLNLTLTVALSWGVWLVVERSPALNLLFNGIAPAGWGVRKRVAREVPPKLRSC